MLKQQRTKKYVAHFLVVVCVAFAGQDKGMEHKLNKKQKKNPTKQKPTKKKNPTKLAT